MKPFHNCIPIVDTIVFLDTVFCPFSLKQSRTDVETLQNFVSYGRDKFYFLGITIVHTFPDVRKFTILIRILS